MTMEAFPHSGQQLASVHPCKHASVMKKFIDRMEAAQATQAEDPSLVSATGNPLSPAGETSKGAAGGKKGKWGIGGMVRRVTGVTPSTDREKKEPSGEEEPSGVQVDFYLVIVSSVSDQLV